MGGIQSQWIDYCPTCLHYNENTGVCAGLHFKIKSHPKRFDKCCDGRLYSGDPQKKKSGDESHPISSHAGTGPRLKRQRKVDVMSIEHPAEYVCAFCQKKEQLKGGVFHFGRFTGESRRQVYSGEEIIKSYQVLGSKTLQFCALCLGKLRDEKKRLVKEYVWRWILGGFVWFIFLRLGGLLNEKSVFGIIFIIVFIGLTLLGLVLLVRSAACVWKNNGDALALSGKAGNESFFEEFVDKEAIRIFQVNIPKDNIKGYTFWTRRGFNALQPRN